jgi:hypothetical protein
MVASRKLSQCLVFLFALVASFSCFAQTPIAQSVIYLDANNNIIGQQMIACNNVAQHAGTISFSNPYKIYQEWPCEPQCHYIGGADGATPSKDIECDNGAYYVMYKNVSGVATANGMTVQQYCSDPSPIYHSVSCDATQPAYAGSLINYQPGFSP